MTIEIPIWSWPLLLALIVYIGCFLRFKEHKTSLTYAIKALLLGLACLVVIAFEDYLDDIFVGHYDEQGMPSHYSHSGWRLLADAWPIWLAPLFLTCVFGTLIHWVYRLINPVHHRHHSPPIKHHPMEDTVEPGMNKMQFKSAKDQLALQEMKQKFELALKRYEEIKHERYQYQSKIKQLELNLAKMAKSQNGGGGGLSGGALDELKEIIDEQNSEISEANELIEHLLQQLYDSGEGDD